MNILKALVGGPVGGAATAVSAIGKVFDSLFTSDEEKLDKKVLLTRLAQQPNLAQTEINKVEAAHRSVFVAGWRPGIGWVCAAALFFFYVPQYLVAAFVWVKTIHMAGWVVPLPPYPVTAQGVLELVLALLGLGTLRTIDKAGGRSK